MTYAVREQWTALLWWVLAAECVVILIELVHLGVL